MSGPKSARDTTDQIFSAMEQLTRFPLSGTPIRDEQLSAAGYRYAQATKHLIFYRLFGDTAVIYHVARGAADYPKLLKTMYF